MRFEYPQMTKCDENGEFRGSNSRTENVDHHRQHADGGVVLGVDGGATSTVCVCIPFRPSSDPNDLPVIGRADAGCSNHNSVGEVAARDTLEKVMREALLKSNSTLDNVQAVCLAISGVNHPKDQEMILNWLRNIFPGTTKLYVHNDSVAALASGTMGVLHGCVLIAGTGCISYGFTEDGREARAGGGGPVLGDWGSGYGISAQALTAVVRAHDGRGQLTMLTPKILEYLGLASTDEIIGWTYTDSSWARIAALVPVVVSCAEAGDETANKILYDAAEDLVQCVKAVVQRLNFAGKDGVASFPVVMAGGILESTHTWDIGKEVMKRVCRDYPGAYPIRPKVEPAVGAALLAWDLLRKGWEGLCVSKPLQEC